MAFSVKETFSGRVDSPMDVEDQNEEEEEPMGHSVTTTPDSSPPVSRRKKKGPPMSFKERLQQRRAAGNTESKTPHRKSEYSFDEIELKSEITKSPKSSFTKTSTNLMEAGPSETDESDDAIENLTRPQPKRRSTPAQKIVDHPSLQIVSTVEIPKAENESRLPTNAPLSQNDDASSLSIFEDTCNKIINSRLKRLTAQEVALNDWEYEADALVTAATSTLSSSIMSNPAYKNMALEKFQKISNEYKSLWTFLQEKFVEPLEKIFEDQICFSDNDFQSTAENLELAAFQDDDLNSWSPILKDKVKQFKDEYQTQNMEVQRLEQETVEVAQKLCADYYRDEMAFLLGTTYSEEIECHHADVNTEAMEIFTEACQLKSSHWKEIYDTELRATIDKIRRQLLTENDGKISDLQKRLEQILNEVTAAYERELTNQKFNLHGDPLIHFHKIEKNFRTLTKQSFDQQASKFPKSFVTPVKEKLTKILSRLSHNRRMALLEEENHVTQLEKYCDEEKAGLEIPTFLQEPMIFRTQRIKSKDNNSSDSEGGEEPLASMDTIFALQNPQDVAGNRGCPDPRPAEGLSGIRHVDSLPEEMIGQIFEPGVKVKENLQGRVTAFSQKSGPQTEEKLSIECQGSVPLSPVQTKISISEKVKQAREAKKLSTN